MLEGIDHGLHVLEFAVLQLEAQESRVSAELSRGELSTLTQRRVVDSPDGRMRVEATPRANLEDLEALRAFEAAVTAIAPPAVGGPVTIVSAGAAAVRAFRSAFLYAFLAIAVVLIVLVRRPLDVLAQTRSDAPSGYFPDRHRQQAIDQPVFPC